MKNEIAALIKKVTLAQEINIKANALINRNAYEDFTRAELSMIASLAADASCVANRTAREKITEWETELAECMRMLDERKQPLYDTCQEEK